MENSYILDAGIGYGKALFKKRQYLNALMVLNYVTASNPKKVYDAPEVLLHIGNANFEVGESRLARQNLNRVLNLFPEIEGRDVILNKIGDTYGMENNKEKAVKVYELVREKFPDSEGYIASSIGIARYLATDPEKVEIYKMIKARFPEHSFARIAMMRLAEIYQANEEYDKCIKEIEDLLSTHPRGLRYEAVKLMQRAYEALFQKQLKADEYTRVLNRYELEHERLDRMGSRKIALTVGLAYLQAKLYEESFNHLINAYKQYPRASRSEQLLLGLGIAMDESGRKEDALKLLNGFAKRFPKSRDQQQALSRAGEIYLDQKNYTLAGQKFHQAFKTAKNPIDRGRMLMSRSNVYEKKGDMETASNLREKAIREMALASGENYEVLTRAYKELGRTYAFLKNYVRSADAYLKALSFSKNDQEKANLGFLLGDAYQKGNIIPKARQAFQQVVTSYDSVWARLAQQRLNTLDLAEVVQNS
jgi:tetratricopeptide (TPR) repeat protein